MLPYRSSSLTPGRSRAERHDTYDSHSEADVPRPVNLPNLAIDGDDGHMPVSAGETRSGHIKDEVAMRYRFGKSNRADGCSVWSRSYQNASNRALHLPMRANQGLVPASASLRASKDVSPFCPPVLHRMDRAAGVSRVRRVLMRAQLLARLSVEEHPRGSGFVARIPGLRALAANLLAANVTSSRPLSVSTRCGRCLHSISHRAAGLRRAGYHPVGQAAPALVIARKAERVSLA